MDRACLHFESWANFEFQFEADRVLLAGQRCFQFLVWVVLGLGSALF
jgi:hypothetical protein